MPSKQMILAAKASAIFFVVWGWANATNFLLCKDEPMQLIVHTVSQSATTTMEFSLTDWGRSSMKSIVMSSHAWEGTGSVVRVQRVLLFCTCFFGIYHRQQHFLGHLSSLWAKRRIEKAFYLLHQSCLPKESLNLVNSVLRKQGFDGTTKLPWK